MRTLLIALALFALTGCPDSKKGPVKTPPPPPYVPDTDLSTELETAPDPLDLDVPKKTAAKTATKTEAKTAAPDTKKTSKTF